MILIRLIIAILGIAVTLSACGGEEVGDSQRGQEIFKNGGGVTSEPCTDCHTLDGSKLTHVQSGPSLQGISDRAGGRVPDLSAEEYLRQSILDPGAYLVEGYESYMSKGYRFILSEEDVDDLVAFLLTQ